MEQPKKIKTENMKEYKREYYQKNKDRLKINKICEGCGSIYNSSTKWHHLRSKKHKMCEMEKKIEELKKLLNN